MIEVENVTKSYGTFTAVNGISLAVNRGEIFSFLGINGAGKTTTIRMLTGILMPTSGKIVIGGHDIVNNPIEAKSLIGYIPDRPYLYNKLTGHEFLLFCSDLYNVPTKTAYQRIEQLLAEYSLTRWQNQLIESYSHGMKQRLAMCAALVHDPQALIIDEPMVGLDPHGARMLKNSLRRYAGEGKAIFLSTHSLNVAEELSDKVAIIHQGRILATGTVSEIRSLSGSEELELESAFIQITAQADEPI